MHGQRQDCNEGPWKAVVPELRKVVFELQMYEFEYRETREVGDEVQRVCEGQGIACSIHLSEG
jgi:hypothetical protein